MNCNRNILGFDSWTKGAHHLQRLLPALAEQGISLKLVHLGSWGNETGRPVCERIGEMEVRDIEFYHGNFEFILDIERPDAVVFLSTQTFAHRAFIRYCDQRSIPTLHIYHGLVNVQVTDDERGSYTLSRVAHAKVVLSKLGKLIRKTFPCYLKALIKTNAALSDWVRFGQDIINMALGCANETAARDAKTSCCAVYSEADIEHACRVYGFKVSEVRAVGNPDLAHFRLTTERLASQRHKFTRDLQKIMYIDTCLVATGLIFSTKEEYLKHIVETARAISGQGRTMLFKPHPGHSEEFLRRIVDESGVELVSTEKFIPYLEDCAACIVETTTLAIVPALLGISLLYANYGKLIDLRFGPVLTSYPRGYFLTNLCDIPTILMNADSDYSERSLREWRECNAGPLPPEAMPFRVAQVILNLICQTSEDQVHH